LGRGRDVDVLDIEVKSGDRDFLKMEAGEKEKG